MLVVALTADNFNQNEYMALAALFVLLAVSFVVRAYMVSHGAETIVARTTVRDPGHPLWSALLPILVLAVLVLTGATLTDGSEAGTIGWLVLTLGGFQGGRIWQGLKIKGIRIAVRLEIEG